jgi:hypothetical protein
MLAVGALDKGRAPAPGVVARAGAFDLDDVGAEIGEQLPGPGAGQHARKLKDFQAFERCGHGAAFGRSISELCRPPRGVAMAPSSPSRP